MSVTMPDARHQLPPILDFANWTILDFELCYEGLSQMVWAGNGLLNQPRASKSKTADFHPGAEFVDDVISGWLDWQVVALIGHLSTIRFPNIDHDHRRVKMLMRLELDYADMPLPALIQMAIAQAGASA